MFSQDWVELAGGVQWRVPSEARLAVRS